jgi:hypothetical protein
LEEAKNIPDSTYVSLVGNCIKDVGGESSMGNGLVDTPASIPILVHALGLHDKSGKYLIETTVWVPALSSKE